jgi:hypothetical protein
MEKMEKLMNNDGCVKRWRRRMTAVLLAFAVFPMIASASVQDKVARFSTPGPDCYADGTLVADGECYALVWSPKGATFAGFNADGTAISANDRVVFAAPLALEGKCRDSLFQIPADEYAELEGGEWAVCLVDTRMANGVPAGVANNAPLRVNRWGAVRNEVKISTASTLALDSIAAPKAGGRSLLAAAAPSEAGVCAGTLSAVPDSVTQPRIIGFEVVDGVARLTVEDTVPFLTYTISAGDTPDALAADDAAGWVDGDTAKPIEIETDAVKGSRFFKVTRAE